MRAWRPAKWKLFSQPNMVFGCVLLFGWDRAANGDPAKNLFSQPNGEDQSPRSDTSATNGIFLRSQIAYDITLSLLPVWTLEALGGNSSA